MVALIVRAFDLQVVERHFLQQQGDARHLRVVTMPAHRGMITDRNGEPLAISTPVDAVWANPQETLAARKQLPKLAKLLGMKYGELYRRLSDFSTREFVYLRRQVPPDLARRVMDLGVPGVALQREYRRYYPLGEVAGHVLGFTNIDDHGQEGLELAYEHWLSGTPGAKEVVRDRLGHVVEEVRQLKAPHPGRDLRISIDRRIQYLAYRELKKAVLADQALSGSVVVMDPRTGEVLAMANQPSFNPNNRDDLVSRYYRNRAVTDVFEPGSTIKPFTVAAALQSGAVNPLIKINTSPGYIRVQGYTIRDDRNLGTVDLKTLLEKSSNVGATKLALMMKPEDQWAMLSRVGFGHTTGSGFPGERSGVLTSYQRWGDADRASAAYGYGLSVTALQLADAYCVLADDGVRHPATFLPVGKDHPNPGERVMRAGIAKRIDRYLEAVVSPVGTAYAARVEGYRVAGKTGTAHKPGESGYARDRYFAVFAGLAPAEDPRLVVVVVINQPSRGKYYGGQVAAPVFSHIMAGSLRILNVPPDNLPKNVIKVEAHPNGPGGAA
ncbi:MAG: penicillin-binding transpeptidase domain-containing protein [Gammaproteobacteria bacterium]